MEDREVDLIGAAFGDVELRDYLSSDPRHDRAVGDPAFQNAEGFGVELVGLVLRGRTIR